MVTLLLIALPVVAAAAFVAGVLFGRKNKNKVEQVVSTAKKVSKK